MSTTGLLGEQKVNRIGFGAMQLAGPGVFGPPADPDGVRAVLRRALELGVDHIDTAQYYGPDVVNELIREALHPYPENLRLVTKLGGARDDEGGWIGAQEPDRLKAGMEENLRTLGVDSMALANLRLMEEGDSSVALEAQLEAMRELRDEGKIEMVGISTASLEQVRTAHETVGIAEVQNAYSVVNRKDEPVVDYCAENGIAYVPYFPLGSAFAGGPKALAGDPAIAGVAERHGVSASKIALAWLLARSEHILLIPGTKSVEHLEENMTVADIELSEEDMQALDGATQLGDPTPPSH